MTLIGGQVLAGTPAPQGASWFSSTQFSAASAPMMNSTAPVEMDTSLAPGAAPWSCRRRTAWSGGRRRCRSRGCRGRHRRACRCRRSSGPSATEQARLERVAQRLEVGDDGAAAVGLLEVGVGRVDAGVDDRDRDALAGQRVPSAPVSGLGGLEAAGGRVGGLLEELDRLVAGLDVRTPGWLRTAWICGLRADARRRRRSCGRWSPSSCRWPARPRWPPAGSRRAPAPAWCR